MQEVRLICCYYYYVSALLLCSGQVSCCYASMDVLVLRLLKVSWPLESLPLIDLPDFLMHIKGLGINQDTGIDNLSVKVLKLVLSYI